MGWRGGSVRTEVILFVGALILLAGILIRSYWFVYAPIKNSDRRGEEQHRSGG